MNLKSGSAHLQAADLGALGGILIADVAADERGWRHARKVVMVQQECGHLAHGALPRADAAAQPVVTGAG